MSSNSSINILGGMPDWNLIIHFMNENEKHGKENQVNESHYSYTSIKTLQAVQRFERAITDTFLKYKTPGIHSLVRNTLIKEGLSSETLLILFWHGSSNNSLLEYLNEHVYFPAFYSGRVAMAGKEPEACLRDSRIEDVKAWSDSTLIKVATKYLTLLKKFGLMEGKIRKEILHPHLTDRMFVLFVYWLSQIEDNSNLLKSKWLKYSFMEEEFFIERLLKKKFVRFFNLTYTGDKLLVEPLFEITRIFDEPISV